MARKTLPLEFGRSFVALACANGVGLRYDVRRLGRGQWELTIEADGLRRTRAFTTERAAKASARADFSRRQLLKLACAGAE